MAFHQFADHDGCPCGSCEIFHADETHVRAYWCTTGDAWPPAFGLRGGDADTSDPAELVGWYWWACFPGCSPDSDPMGPFDSEADAMADAGVAQ